ncbi:serine O-acetyltransferase [Marchantia polymorpha subsp. ruderalis]|uniref:serine O-acetyltransferase n=2 Tax=Marchantia polymorpha TaxID=3197 RepID=A0AAF6BLJ0_MARPO|nr:hypothetical protein MARPO_0010s0095 [Marchantia polymorpha]BBN12874.1 hypothetical protein Mp_5g23610 [Marchantia polymorpha subsp. ruderalis]|eukprot:PTQ46700.1 hypothetical protein MARPO_0010s0095 [Marchantia polymorpha]
MAPHLKEEEHLFGNGSRDCQDDVWIDLKIEAEQMSEERSPDFELLGRELLPEFLLFSILKWNTLEECLATHLSQKLGWSAAPAERWNSVLLTAFREGKSANGEPLSELIRKDLVVVKEQDPACPSLAHALLHYKGYQGLEVYRAANWLWRKGLKSLACIFQSRVSEVFGLDIHPAAQLGWGIMIDHGTGVVIGETAVVGNGCTLLHGVTLGGTGKEAGDRHPKLGCDVLVGAGASILGNVKIGTGAKIGAAAVVLTDIPAHCTAVGCPAKVIGRAKEENPAKSLDHSCRLVEMFRSRPRPLCPFRKLDSQKKGYLGPHEFENMLRTACKVEISSSEANDLFFKMDSDHDGLLTEAEYNENLPIYMEVMRKRAVSVR